MMNNISANEYRRLKNKVLIRHFISIPITISFTIYLYGSLLDGELRRVNELLLLIPVTLITITIMWFLTSTDKQVKREKNKETRKKNKSKKRIAVEYSLIVLVFFLLIVYAIKR